MYATDRNEIAIISQTKSFPSVRLLIEASKYPICLRDSSGKFILYNTSFCQNIDSFLQKEEHWFRNLSVNVQLLLLKAEIESCASGSGVCQIDYITINNVKWRVNIDCLLSEGRCFFVWRFIDICNLKIFYQDKVDKNNKFFDILLSEADDDILPYLLGCSHQCSVTLTGTNISSSKKKIMQFFKKTNLKNRDDFLTKVLTSEEIILFYEKLRNSLSERML